MPSARSWTLAATIIGSSLTFVDDLEGLPDDAIAKVMGGNLNRIMKVAA